MMISLLYYLFKRRVIHAVLKKSNKRFTYYSITHLCRNLFNISIGLQYLLVIEMTSGCKLKEEIENIYKIIFTVNFRALLVV